MKGRGLSRIQLVHLILGNLDPAHLGFLLCVCVCVCGGGGGRGKGGGATLLIEILVMVGKRLKHLKFAH